jgi:hypothetical protein
LIDTDPVQQRLGLVLIPPGVQTTNGVKTTLTWSNLSGFDLYVLVFWGTSWSDANFDGTVIQFGHNGVIDTSAGHYNQTGSYSNQVGFDISNVDSTGCLNAFLIAGARSTGGNKLIAQLASVSTPASPSTTSSTAVGAWTNTATLTDIRLILDAASSTAFPVGGSAALYGLGTGV